MVWTSFIQPFTPLTIACLIKLLVIPSFMLPAQATSIRSQTQTVMPTQTNPLKIPLTKPAIAQRVAPQSRLSQTQWNGFEPPRRGIPGRREAGGTRGSTCAVPASTSDSGRMTALIPASTLGRTASDQLTFFYYVPFVLKDTPVEFELTDENDNTLYQQSFTLTNAKPGIVKLDFSEKNNLPELGVDKNYRWYLTIQCNADDPSANPVLYGWVRRVKLTTAQKIKLAQAPLQERLQLYAEKGLWYETLAVLAQLRSSNPSDSSLQTDWSDLLNAVGLENLVNQPFVPSQLEISSDLDELSSSELQR
ncbi:MAG: DUF928 domain-containing protein [Microcoleaceae cyanobacterium]